MNAGQAIRAARRRAGLSSRALAHRAGTSHATLLAYESGRKTPRVDTLARIIRAAGFEPVVELAARPDGSDDERAAKGRELLDVLELAAQFPTRHDRRLRYPRFGRVA